MVGLIGFLLFWIVFGYFYLTRDKSKDAERERSYH